jgi:hypothetical protein
MTLVMVGSEVHLNLKSKRELNESRAEQQPSSRPEEPWWRQWRGGAGRGGAGRGGAGRGGAGRGVGGEPGRAREAG